MKLNKSSRHLFSDAETIRTYLLGGRGVVTLESPSGEHYTYAFRKPVDDDFPEDVIFIYLVSSEGKLFYLGMLEDLIFRLTKNSRYLLDSSPVKGAKYIVNMMKNNALVARTQMKLYHEGLCGRCGRALSGEDSMQCGFGRTCRKAVSIENG